jgi:hypothetical protein
MEDIDSTVGILTDAVRVAILDIRGQAAPVVDHFVLVFAVAVRAFFSRVGTFGCKVVRSASCLAAQSPDNSWLSSDHFSTSIVAPFQLFSEF